MQMFLIELCIFVWQATNGIQHLIPQEGRSRVHGEREAAEALTWKSTLIFPSSIVRSENDGRRICLPKKMEVKLMKGSGFCDMSNIKFLLTSDKTE